MAKRKITREELVDIRKREQARKEMEQGLLRTIKDEEYERQFRERKVKDANPWIVGIIKFVTVFLVIEAFVFTFGFFLPFFKILYAYGHIMIILLSLLPLVLKDHQFNSLFESILRKFGYL